MRQLRFVKQGDDADHVVLETADGNEQFLLGVDAALRDAARSDLPRPHPSALESEAGIGPREIQVRVRAGESPQELAEANGMTLERVLRFAGPVLAERTRITVESRRARARRSTTEGQTVIFGEAVDTRFAAHGIDPSAVRWDARRREDGQWIVSAHWVRGDAEHTAEWLFHLTSRSVTPLDDSAADLLSDRPIRPVALPPPAEPVRPTLAAAPPLAPDVVAFPAMPYADTGPLPVADDVFDQAAFEDGERHVGETARQPSTRQPSTRQVANRQPAARQPSARQVPTAPDTDHDTPALPVRLAEPVEAHADSAPARGAKRVPRVKNLGIAQREEKAGEKSTARPNVPSWDDILLGVRRKSD